MERLNGRKAFVPKNFTTSMSGGGKYNPHQFTKSLINKNILFHSYDNPCTLEDYSLELGISIPYIEEIVNEEIVNEIQDFHFSCFDDIYNALREGNVSYEEVLDANINRTQNYIKKLIRKK